MKDTKDSNTSVIRPKDFALYIQPGQKYLASISKKNFAAFVEKVTYVETWKTCIQRKMGSYKIKFLGIVGIKKGDLLAVKMMSL